jgi:uncharacterized protein YceK
MGKDYGMKTTHLPKLMVLLALVACKTVAGDIIQTSGGAYAGYVNGRMITTSSSQYGGVILNGRMVVKPDSSYGGYITGNGAIIDETVNTAGFISSWEDRNDK